MRLKKLVKAAVSATICAGIMVGLAGCGEVPEGNIGEVSVNPGDTLAEITFTVGDETGIVRFKLFPDVAPKGVANFISLAENGYYNGKTIHRIVPDFVFQGGSLKGNGNGGTTAEKVAVPRETSPNMRAFYGALCYAEDSDGINSQFFVVNNKKSYDVDAAIEKLEGSLESYGDMLKSEYKKKYNDQLTTLKAISDEAKAKYKSQGGCVSIDGNYTIFGQAIEGFDVIDKISSVELIPGNALDDEKNISSKPNVTITIKKVEIIYIPALEETEPVETTTTRKPRTTTPTEETTQASETAETTISETTATVIDSAENSTLQTDVTTLEVSETKTETTTANS